MKTILTVAGSDSSAGAGIQADLKTISALGGYAATVITAVTAQNTVGVSAVHPIPADIVTRQIDCVMQDLQPTAVKIGMLPTVDVVRAVAACLRRYRASQVVMDPVMVSTSGRVLMPAEAVREAYNSLMPLCTLVTPNLAEAALLLTLGGDDEQSAPISTLSTKGEQSTPILSTLADMEQAALTLSRRLGTSVLIKGGHLTGDQLCDVLCHDGRLTHFPSPRIATRNLHGTGCTLSSAIATLLAMGLPLPRAVGYAIDYLHQAIRQGRDLHIGQGNGPLQHFVAFPLPPEYR